MLESIIAQDVNKSFARDGERVEVLKGVTLTVAAGELAAIVGPSGVGKSTLLHLLGGLERPTSGTIRYGETDLAGLSDLDLARFRNRRVGFVFQFHHLLAGVLRGGERDAAPPDPAAPCRRGAGAGRWRC